MDGPDEMNPKILYVFSTLSLDLVRGYSGLTLSALDPV